MNTVLKRSSFGNVKSMKYDSEFWMECVLLRIKSKAAYQSLRTSKLLPLPSLSTLRRLISSMPCSFSINEFALSAIKRNLTGQPSHMLAGSLVWDEMTIESTIDFNPPRIYIQHHSRK